MKAYFILGTDTDSGKTYVTCELVRALRATGQRVLAIKPVASGCFEQAGRVVSGDELLLQEANGPVAESLSIGHWRLMPPIAPHIAAQSAGIQISVAEICDYYMQFTDYEYVLMEGAGGLMVPLNDQETWLDFLMVSQIPVILVVGLKLGCINHALLTAFALKEKQIPLLGWIANAHDPKAQVIDAVIQTLEQRMGAPLLARVPFGQRLQGFDLSSINGD